MNSSRFTAKAVLSALALTSAVVMGAYYFSPEKKKGSYITPAASLT